jgi:hypothetical protein
LASSRQTIVSAPFCSPRRDAGSGVSAVAGKGAIGG